MSKCKLCNGTGNLSRLKGMWIPCKKCEGFGEELSKPAMSEKVSEELRDLFEKHHCLGSKQAASRNEHGDYVLRAIDDAWSGFLTAAECVPPRPAKLPDVDVDKLIANLL